MCYSPGVKHGNRAMVVAVHKSKRLKKSAVDLAIAAVEGNPNPLDVEMDIDPDPTTLGLPEEEYQEACSNPRCSRPAVGTCSECGSLL